MTMATDEVLIQFGGRAGGATEVVCSLADQFRVSFTLPNRQSDNYLGQVPLSNIHIYSTKLSKWFTHSLDSKATLPILRYAFCTVVKLAPDQSSHQEKHRRRRE